MKSSALDIPGPNPFNMEAYEANAGVHEAPEPRENHLGLDPIYAQRRASSAFLQPPVHSSDIEVPVISIPELTDSLSTLLLKHIPPQQRPVRDVSGSWENMDFHNMVARNPLLQMLYADHRVHNQMSNNWRALACMARDRIITASPNDLTLVLGLWYLRLSCLARMHLNGQATTECNNLFSVLQAVDPAPVKQHLFDNIIPFELEVLHTRIRYWSGDPYGYLDVLSALASKCDSKAQKAVEQPVIDTWKERSARLALLMASQLVEMKEYEAAVKSLEPLCENDAFELYSAIGRISLQAGQLDLAAKVFSLIQGQPEAPLSLKTMNSGLEAMAVGDWKTAANIYTRLQDMEPRDVAAANNHAIALLNQGNLTEAISVLESISRETSPLVFRSEPFLFNISTLYELCSSISLGKKRGLLVEAAKWSGDGLRSNVLKLN